MPFHAVTALARSTARRDGGRRGADGAIRDVGRVGSEGRGHTSLGRRDGRRRPRPDRGDAGVGRVGDESVRLLGSCLLVVAVVLVLVLALAALGVTRYALGIPLAVRRE